MNDSTRPAIECLSTRFFVWSLKEACGKKEVVMKKVSVHDFLYGHLRFDLASSVLYCEHVSVHDFLYGHLRNLEFEVDLSNISLSTRFFVWSLKDVRKVIKRNSYEVSVHDFLYGHLRGKKGWPNNPDTVSVHDFLYGHLR